MYIQTKTITKTATVQYFYITMQIVELEALDPIFSVVYFIVELIIFAKPFFMICNFWGCKMQDFLYRIQPVKKHTDEK